MLSLLLVTVGFGFMNGVHFLVSDPAMVKYIASNMPGGKICHNNLKLIYFILKLQGKRQIGGLQPKL